MKKFLITDEDTIKKVLDIKDLNYDFEEALIFGDWELGLYWLESLQKNATALFKKSVLSFKNLFDVILNSHNNETIGVASLFMYYIDFEKSDENRERLLNYLLKLNTSTNKNSEKIKIVIWETRLYDSTNKRTILGKSYTEIQADAEYYKNLAEFAKGLLR